MTQFHQHPQSFAAGWALSLFVLAAGCDSGKDPVLGSDGVVTAPRVTASTPANAATNVSVRTSALTATFSQPVNPIAGTATFTVSCPAPCISPTGTVTLDSTNTIATLTLNGVVLAPLTLYTARIAGATSRATGLALANPFVWTFTTGGVPDVVPPAVTSTIPATATLNVRTNSAVTAVFSEDMGPSTINATSFTVTCVAPCVAPAGTVSYVASSKTAVFTPTAALATATLYTATLTNAATDVSGNPLIPYVWTFTTGLTADSTRPVVLFTVPATTVPGPTPGSATNTAINASFSEDMAPASIRAASFTLTCASPCVTPNGAVSYVVSSRTAIFTAAAPLSANTTYTATITSAATDLAGNALGGNQAALPAASNYIWTFTTGATPDTTAPTIASTNPLNNAVGVCTNKTINATFSESVDPLTMTAANFRLTVTGGAAVAGVVTYDALNRIASFNPVANLTGTPATSYTATIVGSANGVKDTAGNALAADATITFTTNASVCATAPALGAAAVFGAFGGNAGLTNNGLGTTVNGDVGVNALSTSITGVRDSGGNVYTTTASNNGLVNGLVYTQTAPPGSVAGVTVTQARVDALLAFTSLSPTALPGGIDVSDPAQCPSCGGVGNGADELAGRTLPPGVYRSTTGAYDIGGVGRTAENLILDAGGDVDAVWIFQSAAGTGTLNVGLAGPATPAVPIKVLLINGAQSKNVFWYAPAGAGIGTGSTLEGTLLTDGAITVSAIGGTPPSAVPTTLNGRAIALTAAVTLTNAVINVPAP